MTLVDYTKADAQKSTHVLVALVENKPGVAHARGKPLPPPRTSNIESLTVGTPIIPISPA